MHSHITRILYMVLAFLVLAPAAFAADVKTAEGTATYIGDESMSRAQCKARALEAARNQAMANAFGTHVYQVITTRDQVSNGLESSFADFVAATQMGGIWLGDIDEPKYKIVTDDEGNYEVTCTVKGKVRERSNSPADFNVMVCNKPGAYAETTKFQTGENIYAEVSAPSAGYIAVYLADDQGNVQTFFPYLAEEMPFVKMAKNKVYTLFDPNANQPSEASVDAIKLVTDRAHEYCDLYVVFSPNSFSKAKDRDGGVNMPRSLTLKAFNRWLIDIQQNDPNMAVKRIPIEIVGENDY